MKLLAFGVKSTKDFLPREPDLQARAQHFLKKVVAAVRGSQLLQGLSAAEQQRKVGQLLEATELQQIFAAIISLRSLAGSPPADQNEVIEYVMGLDALADYSAPETVLLKLNEVPSAHPAREQAGPRAELQGRHKRSQGTRAAPR